MPGIRTATSLFLLLVLPLLAACARHSHIDYDASRAAGLYTMTAGAAAGIYDYYAPTPAPEIYATPNRRADGYSVYGIRFQSSEINGQPGNLVDARYFQSLRNGEPKPLLIVLPIWATHTFPPTVISHGYAKHSRGDANILWMQGDGALYDWFKLGRIKSEEEFHLEASASAERFRAAAIDARRLIDWAETRPEIDTDRIAIIGFSMGAIVAANIAGNEPRIHTAVYVLGGARPWDIMAECGVVVGYMRKGVKRNLEWSQEQFVDYFHRQLAFGDPARWRGHYRPENTLIIESSRDDCMPASSREALVYATGEPERIVFPYNHWQPFLSMTPVGGNQLSRDIYEFLDRKLFTANPQPKHRLLEASQPIAGE